LRKLGIQVLLLVFIISLLAAAAGCGETTPQKLTIGLLPIEDALPFFVAEEKGYFREAGVEVELEIFKSAVERDGAFQAGRLDGGVADVVATAAMVQSGLDVKIISLTVGATPAEGRFAILSAPNSNLRTVKDLAGVEIAVSSNSIIEYVTDQVLTENGLQPDEIEKIVVPKIPVRYELLMNGKVQAATLPDPLAALAEAEGANLVADDTKAKNNYSQVVILFTGTAVKNKERAIEKMLDAYERAVREINANPESFRELLVSKARVPEKIIETYQVTHFALPQVPQVKEVEMVIHWMQAKGLLEKPVAYDDLVEDKFVR